MNSDTPIHPMDHRKTVEEVDNLWRLKCVQENQHDGQRSCQRSSNGQRSSCQAKLLKKKVGLCKY